MCFSLLFSFSLFLSLNHLISSSPSNSYDILDLDHLNIVDMSLCSGVQVGSSSQIVLVSMKSERPKKLKSEKMRFLMKPIRESAWRQRFGKKASELADPPLPPTHPPHRSLALWLVILFGLGWEKRLGIWVGGFYFFFPLLWTVGGGGCGCGCGWLLKFGVDIFIIILMSYLYYFNQIAKNIDLLMLGVTR